MPSGFGASAALLLVGTVVASGLCVLGCGSSQADPKPAPRTAKAQPAPPGRWVFHPKGPQPVSARTPLGEAELVVDRGGSRWLVHPTKPAEPAAYGAPEALVAARRTGEGFAFVGESGAFYAAQEPLGPFLSVRRPPELSFRATVHEDVVLAVGQDGRLRRSTDLGRSWQVVPIDGFLTDVALDRQGRALAVSVPEQWHWSTDRGASFRLISPGTVAPEELDGSGDHVRVLGWLGTYDFDGTAFRPGAATPGSSKATWTLPRGPSAIEVRSAHAVLDQEFLGLVREKEGFSLLLGELGGSLRERPAAGLRDCARYRLAKRADQVAVLCAERAEAGRVLQLGLWLGDTRSARFERQTLPLWGDFERTRLALGPDGTLALSGVCSPTEQAAGCTPRGTFVLPVGAPKLTLVPTAFEELPLALTFSAAGDLVVGAVREKDGHALVLSWTPARGGLGRLIDLSAELELPVRASSLEVLPSKAPLLGVLVQQGDRVVTLSLDAAGRVVTSGRAPYDTVAIHGAGLRLAAVSTTRRAFFESADGGVTWAESALPRPICPGALSDCTPALVCSDAGCLLGDELSRVGWGEAAVLSGVSSTPGSAKVSSTEHSPDYVCRIDAERPLDLRGLLEIPGAGEAALGDADFTAVEFEPQSAAVEFAWVRRGQRRIERTTGLDAVSEPDRYALSVVPQVEGAAALRYRVPVRQTGDRMLSEIEVAWNNRLVGVTGRQRFPSLIEGRQGDYQPASSGSAEALPQLLSVAGRGLYLAVHRSASGSQPTYYFEGGSLEELPPPRFPEALGDDSDAEYLHIGTAHVPLAFSESRSRVLLGGAPGSGVALLLGQPPLASARAQGMRLGYRGERIGVVSMMADVDGAFWTARFAELGGAPGQVLGEVVRVPLKADLAALPLACSEETRKQTPRVVAPPFPGPSPRLRVTQGHSVLASFVLGSAVLHGTPEEACLAAWAGEPDARAGSTPEGSGVLLLPTPTGLGGWFFSARAEERPPRGYDAWPLSCELAQ